ncbi:ubiquitin carboxyl-terminal hydrolase 47-like [Daktulosphaira vitifoliae]|uniref:ubiquitin carboxyl-terminal hydrolase 47-like n=1 Tax=Daktulosphaira vitifoliae TaxID=58002 RepID=UPI0021AACB87|nr:ubiquitin carboxyl-terminal hydrolase 47-like [Daktulosphaira vitifoliae]
MTNNPSVGFWKKTWANIKKISLKKSYGNSEVKVRQTKSQQKSMSVWNFCKQHIKRKFELCLCCVKSTPDELDEEEVYEPLQHFVNPQICKELNTHGVLLSDVLKNAILQLTLNNFYNGYLFFSNEIRHKEKIYNLVVNVFLWKIKLNYVPTIGYTNKIVKTPQNNDSGVKKHVTVLKKKTLLTFPTISRVSQVGRGLKNQGATCYLNAYIQVLFHTPEFRNVILNMAHDRCTGDDISYNVGQQLRNLFLRLLERKTSAVETNELTNSFGWTQKYLKIQQDAQEFSRYLLGVLSKQLQTSTSSNSIEDFFQGIQTDYITCTMCNNTVEKFSTFLDISLPIRPFGATRSYGSLESAIDGSLQPEFLEGENAYFCGFCEKKCFAIKGYRWTKLPLVLCFHLGRTILDMKTLRTKKINDRVTFPFFLKMPFEDQTMIYELYSVIVHRGSANFGHYFAYVKVLKTNKWFEFNDHVVSRVNPGVIKSTFGGKANAYMLFYRLLDKSNK